MSDCGGPSSTGDCWCNSDCASYEDCCDNYEDTCGGEFLLLSIAILNESLPKQF